MHGSLWFTSDMDSELQAVIQAAQAAGLQGEALSALIRDERAARREADKAAREDDRAAREADRADREHKMRLDEAKFAADEREREREEHTREREEREREHLRELASYALDLDFLPLYSERYDLLIPEEYAKSELLVPLMDLLEDPKFRKAVSERPGYDVSSMGKIVM